MNMDWKMIQGQLSAFVFNILSWIFDFFRIQTKSNSSTITSNSPICIYVDGPGGLNQLKSLKIGNDEEIFATVGYNIPAFRPPYVKRGAYKATDHPNLVLVKINYFSINYADICIRWGLYESALRYVGWPIVPGFDFSGVVEEAGSDSNFQPGDKVFGFTMFGAYSSRILVPHQQLQKIPVNSLHSLDQYAGFPAVAATALHALSVAGGWPGTSSTHCRAALVHSAAGGVGSMLLQLLKLQGYSPIVAVVGSRHKADACRRLGADFVIDKSSVDLWAEVRKISKEYIAIFDANGVETLQQSFNHLARCGHLVTYGFHSNLPKNSSYLSPLTWIRMIVDLVRMPRFDSMQLVLESKSVSGFNLSFFAEEHALIATYMTTLTQWVESGALKFPDTAVMEMKNIRSAHELIQSGASIGKIVMRASGW